jgi:hypothetical protein
MYLRGTSFETQISISSPLSALAAQGCIGILINLERQISLQSYLQRVNH